MPQVFLRKYGVAATIPITLYEVDGVDMRVDAVHASGDTKITKDEGTEANTTNGFVDEGSKYSILLSATEMQAARISGLVIDQTATKVWLDTDFVIETYGNASAQHAVDLDDAVRAGLTALPNAAADAAGGLPISDAGGLDLDGKVGALTFTVANQLDSNVITKTGFSLASTGLDAIVSTATGMVEIAKAIWDRVLTGATHNISSSAGRRLRGLQDFGNYLGQIHVDTVGGTAGTVVDENGTLENPVLTWADALTLNATLNYNSFNAKNGSTILLTADSTGYVITGSNWELQWGGQVVTGIFIAGANKISGTCTDGGTKPRLLGCMIEDVTMPPFEAIQCCLKGDIIANAIGDYELVRCHSLIAGATTPSFDFGALLGNVNLTMPGYAQGIELKNFNATGTDLFSISGQGKIVYAASCSGTVNQRGDWNVTNTGGVTITADDNTANVEDIQTQIGTAGAGLIDLGGMSTGMKAEVNAEADTAIADAALATAAALATVDTNIDTLLVAVAALPITSEVRAEIVAAFITDTYAEPTGAVAATASMKDMMNWVKTFLRNKQTQTATTTLLRNDADSATISTSTVSDDTVTFIRGKHS